jgi:hypothetical protein
MIIRRHTPSRAERPFGNVVLARVCTTRRKGFTLYAIITQRSEEGFWVTAHTDRTRVEIDVDGHALEFARRRAQTVVVYFTTIVPNMDVGPVDHNRPFTVIEVHNPNTDLELVLASYYRIVIEPSVAFIAEC